MTWCMVKHRDNFTLPNIIRVISSKKVEISGIFSMCVGYDNCIQNFSRKA